MSKRRLTKQQQQRIKKTHDKRLSEAKQELSSDIQSEQQSGVIVSHYGATLDVEDDDGNITQCSARQNIEVLVCGDEVYWSKGDDSSGVITALKPRRTLLARADFYGKIKPVAANIDQVLIIFSSKPMFREELIDHYLIATESLDITPRLVLNKSDLINSDEQAIIDTQLAGFSKIGYPIITTCATTDNGLDQLISLLANKTSILVGQSGVGKSTIIKHLLPDVNIAIGAISETKHKGRHTTTVSRLYHLPTGGNIIDSPGVRDFALGSMSSEKIIYGFIEFRPFIGRCKFKNCTHKHEPDCAFKQALKEGKISQRRLNSYHSMVEKIKDTKM